jgi:hypothetical protein
MNVTIARYALGVVALAVVCGGPGLAAIALRRRLFPGWAGALARLAESVIGLAALIAMLEALGTVGLFSLAPIVVTCALVGLVAVGFLRGSGRARSPAPGGVAAGGAVLVGAVVLAEWGSPLVQAYNTGIHTFDSLWYHLPWAASFAQTGQVTRHFDVEFLTAFYPGDSELLHGLGIVLFGRDTLSPGLNLLWLGLALLAAWCIGRPRGVALPTVLAVGVVLATPMIVFSQPGSADNDVLGVYLLLASAALLAGGEGRPAALVLAGVAAGLALSVKLTFLAPVCALSVGVIAVAPRGGRAAAAWRWLLALVLAGGFWFARNLLAVGNPLPWSSLSVLPTPAPPLSQHATFSVAHYLTDSRFWSDFFVKGMASQLGGWWWVILGLAVIGPLLCVAPGAGRSLRMLALVALASLAAYIVTPAGAGGPDGDPVGFAFNLRYATPGFALAFAVLPSAPLLASPRRRQALLAALVLVLVATIVSPPLWPAEHAAAALLLGAVVLAIGLAAVWLRRRAALLLGAAALALAGCAGGYALQRHYLRGRYQYEPGISHLSGVWALFRRIGHARIGIAGTYGGYFSYPLFGLDDSNAVGYVASHGPHGSFTPISTCRGWRTAVNRGHYRYLLTTPDRDFWRPRQLQPSPEGAWTIGDPAARVILRQPVTGLEVYLFELRGPLNPAACPPG